VGKILYKVTVIELKVLLSFDTVVNEKEIR